MSHFAKVVGGIVTQVIVAEQEFIDSFQDPEPGEWIQTSYNTIGGVHKFGGVPLRKNYAGIGYTFDATRDAFIPPTPFNSWILNEDSCLWDSPVPYPDSDVPHFWNEELQQWDPVEPTIT